MVQAAVVSLLVTTVRLTTLLTPAQSSTPVPTVAVPTVAGPADPKQNPAELIPATPLAKNLFPAVHLSTPRGVDKGGRLWEPLPSSGGSPLGLAQDNPGRFHDRGFLFPYEAENIRRSDSRAFGAR